MSDTFKGIVTADGKKRQLPYGSILDIPKSDPSLTVEGGFADAAVVGKKNKKTDEAIASLKEDISNKITKFYASSQGKPHLADSDNGKIMDMMLYGKSEQKQYSGKNLFDKSTSKSAWISDDGIYIEKGEIGENTDVVSDYISVKENSTYIASFKTNYAANLIYWCTYNANKEFVSITKIANKITIPTGIRYVRVMISMQQQYCVAVNDELQVELGTEPTSYEPYTGGIPSPNPDYPQEIKSVVNPTVKVCGKNLINFTKEPDVSGLYGGWKIPKKDEEYATISLYEKNVNVDISGIFFGFTNTGIDASVGLAIWLINEGKLNTKTQTQIHNYISVFPNDRETINKLLSKYDIQIEVGSTPTAFEPYHEQTVTLPYTLNAIPVSSGGNVTIDGQQYIADYVDVERGKLVRMAGKLTISKAKVPKDDQWYDAEKSYSYEVGSWEIIQAVKKICISDHLTGYNFNDFYKKGIETGMLAGFEYTIVNISKRLNVCTTIDEFVTWFNESNVIGILETPEEIDLAPEEIATLKALATYYPVTNISVNSEQLDGYTVFNYPISMKNGWDYVKQQIGDTREYIYNMDARTQDTDLQAAEAYVNSEYAVVLTELEV